MSMKPRDKLGPKRGPGKPSKASKLGKPRSIKNEIRSVERLLRKPDLDPKMRARQLAKLEELQGAQAEHDRKERERKYAVRYHKIRFFERVKLERRLHRLEARLAAAQAQGGEAGGQALQQLQQQAEGLRQDLQYVKHFPKGEKYVSLLREADTPEAQAVLDAERARLRTLVKQQLAEAAMLAEADEGAGLAGRNTGAGSQAVQHVSAEAGAAVVDEDQDDFFLGSDEETQEPQADEAAGSSEARKGGPALRATARQKRKRAQAPQDDAEKSSGEAGSAEEGGSGGDVESSDSHSDSQEEEGGEEQEQQHHQAASHPQQQEERRAAPKGKLREQKQQQGQQGRPRKRRQHAGKQTWKRQQHEEGVGQRVPGGSRPQEPAQSKQRAAHVQAGGRPNKKQQVLAGSGGSKAPPDKPMPRDSKQPLRTRAEGGRKRRKKS